MWKHLRVDEREGDGVIHGPGRSIPRGDRDPPPVCRACTITNAIPGKNIADVASHTAEYMSRDVVVISAPTVDGLVVVPREHINGLEELPVLRRANVLAALRRAARRVRDQSPESVASVIAMTEPPASASHVCFRVLAGGTSKSQ